MTEQLIGIGLKVTCADHGIHEGVMMKIVDGVVICETLSGEQLKGDCCVVAFDGGTFVVPPFVFAKALAQYRGQV